MKERNSDLRFKHYAKDNIVTTLDSILDTRIGLLYGINEDITEEILDSGLYHNRIRDNFGPISQDVFRAIYRYRTKELLKYSIQTILIRDLIAPLLRGVMDMPHKGAEVQPILFINTYPYNLTEAEQRRIRIIIANVLHMATEFVITIHLDYNEFNSKWINENAHTLIMYDGMEWLEYQTSVSDLNKDPLVGARLFTPFLLTGSMGINDITEDKIKTLVDFYRLVMDIEFVDASFFSFPERKKSNMRKEKDKEDGKNKSVHKSTDEE